MLIARFIQDITTNANQHGASFALNTTYCKKD
jgi:hypothetical protein